MNFVQATNTLINNIRMEDLAIEMSVSRGLLAQSRLHPSNPQHREPPDGWEAAVVKVARRRAIELARLADRLSTAGGTRRRAKKSGKATRSSRKSGSGRRKVAATKARRTKSSSKRARKSGGKRR